MSLFKNLEKTAEFKMPSDNTTTKITNSAFDSLPLSFEAPLNAIYINDQDMIIEEDILGEIRANVRGENRDRLKRGMLCRIKGEKQIYRLVRNPKPQRMFKRTKIYLKRT